MNTLLIRLAAHHSRLTRAYEGAGASWVTCERNVGTSLSANAAWKDVLARSQSPASSATSPSAIKRATASSVTRRTWHPAERAIRGAALLADTRKGYLSAPLLTYGSLRGLDLNQRPLGYETGGLVPSSPSGAVSCRPVRASCRRAPPCVAELRVVRLQIVCTKASNDARIDP